jgi:hypothetical protein
LQSLSSTSGAHFFVIYTTSIFPSSSIFHP